MTFSAQDRSKLRQTIVPSHRHHLVMYLPCLLQGIKATQCCAYKPHQVPSSIQPCHVWKRACYRVSWRRCRQFPQIKQSQPYGRDVLISIRHQERYHEPCFAITFARLGILSFLDETRAKGRRGSPVPNGTSQRVQSMWSSSEIVGLQRKWQGQS